MGIYYHIGLISVILIFFLPNLYNVFFPDAVSDAVRYHLPYAKFYVENHGLAVNEYLRYPLFSHNINMAFSLGYLFLGPHQGEVLARMFISLSFLLIIIGLYSMVAKEFNKVMAVIACAILLQVKSLNFFMVIGYIDIGLTMFVFACLFFLYLWQNEQQRKCLYFSAIMLGIAIGSKYLALVWLLPITLWVFLTHFKWKDTMLFFVIALLVGSPWYIRNIIIAGNPIHPFAQDFFGYWLWSPRDIDSQKQDLLIRHGIGRNITNFIKLPWLLSTDEYFKKTFMGWFLIAGIPLTLCAMFMKKYFKFMAVFIILNLIFWFFTSQILRYMYIVLPLLAIFAAYPFGIILQWIYNKKFYSYIKTNTLLAVVLLVSSSLYYLHTFNKASKRKSLPGSTEQWLQWKHKRNHSYPIAKLLNDRGATRVFSVSKAFLQNDFNGLVLGDWYGKANMAIFARQSKSAEDVRVKMKGFDVEYLVIGKKVKFMNRINSLLVDNPEFEVIFENDDDILYYLQR